MPPLPPRLLPPLLALAILLTGCGDADVPDDDLTAIQSPGTARIVSAEQAVAGANLPTLDPHTMHPAEIEAVIGAGPRCTFHYTSAGGPVMAVAAGAADADPAGALKINGSLVPWRRVQTGEQSGGPAAFTLEAAPMRATVIPLPGDPAALADGRRRWEATMRFTIADELDAGYRGYLECPAVGEAGAVAEN